MLVWWKLQVSWCYCVEYVRFSPLLIFLHFTSQCGYIVKVWWGKWQVFYCKLLAESNGERLTKLLKKNIVGLLLTHTVCRNSSWHCRCLSQLTITQVRVAEALSTLHCFRITAVMVFHVFLICITTGVILFCTVAITDNPYFAYKQFNHIRLLH